MNYGEEQPDWKKDIAPFERSDIKRSLWQLANSIVPFLLLWYLAYLSLSVSIWITLALAIPTAGFFIRIFIIFHDCAHHSFFKNRKANELIGIVTGILVSFPYHQWKYEHAVHHATSSNLNRRGTGDIWTLTVNEYLALSPLHKTIYQVYRNPLVMFGMGPIHLFLIEYRSNRKGAGRKECLNTHVTSLVRAGIVGLLCWALDWKGVLLLEASVLYLSGMLGIWLFYVQHQFEDTYFQKEDIWDYVSAAIKGSSFYKLPKILQWMTGNIGFHHVHHLSSRIPNYNLQRACESIPFLQNVPSIGLLSSLRSLRYRLWDEQRSQFVSFGDIKNLRFESTSTQ
ncbi:MAG: fatty acid desaturase [Bacilli bacterium]|nr:fatty acid desaturase [Bacilli bacterium]